MGGGGGKKGGFLQFMQTNYNKYKRKQYRYKTNLADTITIQQKQTNYTKHNQYDKYKRKCNSITIILTRIKWNATDTNEIKQITVRVCVCVNQTFLFAHCRIVALMNDINIIKYIINIHLNIFKYEMTDLIKSMNIYMHNHNKHGIHTSKRSIKIL